MPNWLLKSAVQRTISWLPYSHYWNGLLQKYVTKGYLPNQGLLEGKLKNCNQHLDYYRKFSANPRNDFTAFELGTGSRPIVPIGLYLCGAKSIWTYDLHPVLEENTTKHVVKLFRENIKNGSISKWLANLDPDRIEKFMEISKDLSWKVPNQFLFRLDIHAKQGDASKTDISSSSIDLVFSTVVLEHIAASTIHTLYKEFSRITSEDSIMSHHIGLADQYASFDKSISEFNFLQYSSKEWKWRNNPMIPLTRLRINEHRKITEESGFKILHEDSIKGKESDLKSIKLAREFIDLPLEDLLVLYAWIVSKPLHRDS